MPSRLPAPLRVPLACLGAAANVVVHVLPLLALAVVKALVPVAAFRRAISAALVVIAEHWIALNGHLLRAFTHTRFEVEGREGLRRNSSYLVLANHQSWVDILVLQDALNRRIPFLRFFLKQQLIWVPLLGLAWWALDFPFMRRYSRETLERHPELRGKDSEATRRACAKFAELPVSVMNFVEGTRFTTDKHVAQQSPYRHLLKPKAGGVALVLESMGGILRGVIDVTVVYPAGRPTLMDLLADRVPRVDVQVRELSIPAELLGGDYENDPACRERFQAWVNALWTEKDALMAGFTANA
ncbi:MAG TPA: acyltransferase [Xanthomonadales bacterium]|nr:acyltransferase [Xanthomonadales bacterium]